MGAIKPPPLTAFAAPHNLVEPTRFALVACLQQSLASLFHSRFLARTVIFGPMLVYLGNRTFMSEF